MRELTTNGRWGRNEAVSRLSLASVLDRSVPPCVYAGNSAKISPSLHPRRFYPYQAARMFGNLVGGRDPCRSAVTLAEVKRKRPYAADTVLIEEAVLAPSAVFHLVFESKVKN